MGQKQFKACAPVLPEQYEVIDITPHFSSIYKVKCPKMDCEEIMKIVCIKNVKQENLQLFITILKGMPLLYTENITQYSLLHKKDEYLVYTMEEYESSLYALHNELNGLAFTGSNILYEIINAISILHDNNIIHGNIKPTNILLSINHHYYLSDYCLNILQREEEGRGGEDRKELDIYKLNYTSPEMLCEKEYSFSTDIWSFGCVLIFLLTGKNPFGSDSIENVKNRILKCDWLLPNQPIDELYSNLLMSTMYLDKNDRKNIEQLRLILRFKDDMKKRKEILSSSSSFIISPNEISIHSATLSSSLLSNQLSFSLSTNNNCNNTANSGSTNNTPTITPKSSSSPSPATLFNGNEENITIYINNLINRYIKSNTSSIRLKWRDDIFISEGNMMLLIDEMKKNSKSLEELHFTNFKFNINDNDVNNNISIIFFNSLIQFKSLTKIDLSNNKINDEVIILLSKQLRHLPQLLSLYLNNNIFGSNGFLHLCYNFRFIPHLKELKLSKVNMNEYSFKYLCCSFLLIPNLECLDLSNNKLIGNDMKCFVQYLRNITNLKKLNIGNNLLTHLGVTYLCNSFHFISDLIELNIENIELYSDGIKTLCKYFTQISNLTSINISKNHIQNDGLIHLSSHLKYITKLKNLSISRTDISSNGLNKLVKNFSSISKLETIDISYNNGKSIVVKDFIHSISYFSKLKCINIGGINIGDDSMILLSEKLIYLPYLHELNISSNNLSDNSIEISSISFNNCKYFKILNISNNYIRFISTIVKLIRNVSEDLEELDLSNNQLENDNSDCLLENLTVLSSLKRLNMSNINISNLTTEKISEFLSSFSKLEMLDISNNNLNELSKMNDDVINSFSTNVINIKM